MTNKEEVQTFWMERLNELKHSENIYTIGMRGVHDGKNAGYRELGRTDTGIVPGDS